MAQENASALKSDPPTLTSANIRSIGGLKISASVPKEG
jgi:hypothetical protein